MLTPKCETQDASSPDQRVSDSAVADNVSHMFGLVDQYYVYQLPGPPKKPLKLLFYTLFRQIVFDQFRDRARDAIL